MENLSGTIDPSCLQQPPLAIDIIIELDALGIILYAGLTLMAVLSMLIYIEGTIYIFRKVPYPKKQAIIWVNGAAPIIATMSCLGMWIPRATMFTDMTSGCYFAVVVYEILVLLLAECGGDEEFLQRCGNNRLRISTGPCCCCCRCLPHVLLTRRVLFLLKLGSFQYALMKTVCTVLAIVLWTNGNFDLSDLEVTGALIWINCSLGVMTIVALWPGAILFMHLRQTLSSQKIIPKYAMYQVVLVLSQLQTAIFSILSLNGTIACTPPYSSQARGSMMSQQLLIPEMFIITLVTRLLYRRTYEPLSAAPLHQDSRDRKLLPSECDEA
ncbi:organic solute transporter subunit alpha-like [Brienomyrus brachyistius]|uniref:organic solute transporter subunit alpha-like n=1 Tax=Brienomyrus brachyistius TaxID=42636 RepID=UPI0020B32C92|nr:organic solute transporter subunit alpha-like [Brienomyrus brachyistius]